MIVIPEQQPRNRLEAAGTGFFVCRIVPKLKTHTEVNALLVEFCLNTQPKTLSPRRAKIKKLRPCTGQCFA